MVRARMLAEERIVQASMPYWRGELARDPQGARRVMASLASMPGLSHRSRVLDRSAA
jgi:hypothetical protein